MMMLLTQNYVDQVYYHGIECSFDRRCRSKARLFDQVMGSSPQLMMFFKNVVRYDDIILVVEHELLVSESDIRRQK